MNSTASVHSQQLARDQHTNLCLSDGVTGPERVQSCAGSLPVSWGAAGAFPALQYMGLASTDLSGSLPNSWAAAGERHPCCVKCSRGMRYVLMLSAAGAFVRCTPLHLSGCQCRAASYCHVAAVIMFAKYQAFSHVLKRCVHGRAIDPTWLS